MQRNSATYMFVFAAIVCVVCAVFVSGAAVALNERQDANASLDKQKNVLYAAGLTTVEEGLDREAITSLFDERVEAVAVDMSSHQETDQIDPLQYDMAKAAAGPEGADAPANNAGVKRLSQFATVYKVKDDAGNVEMVVLPISGYGLWSTLYGFLALDSDGTTVRGITYYQHGETPGLGGEVDNPAWKSKWPGRKVYGDAGNVQLRVIKGQAGPASSDPHQVDGLSGATITSRGVSNMIDFWLGEQGFGPYLDKIAG